MVDKTWHHHVHYLIHKWYRSHCDRQLQPFHEGRWTTDDQSNHHKDATIHCSCSKMEPPNHISTLVLVIQSFEQFLYGIFGTISFSLQK